MPKGSTIWTRQRGKSGVTKKKAVIIKVARKKRNNGNNNRPARARAQKRTDHNQNKRIQNLEKQTAMLSLGGADMPILTA